MLSTTKATTSWMWRSASSRVRPHVAAPCRSSAGQVACHFCPSRSTWTRKT
jgi:hypothetical protein